MNHSWGGASISFIFNSFFIFIVFPEKKSNFLLDHIEDFVCDSVVATEASPRKLGNVALVAGGLGEK